MTCLIRFINKHTNKLYCKTFGHFGVYRDNGVAMICTDCGSQDYTNQDEWEYDWHNAYFKMDVWMTVQLQRLDNWVLSKMHRP